MLTPNLPAPDFTTALVAANKRSSADSVITAIVIALASVQNLTANATALESAKRLRGVPTMPPVKPDSDNANMSAPEHIE